MKWTTTTANFKYSGTPVTRTTCVCNTPLGQFRAYESVNGTPRYKTPFVDKTIQNGVKGLDGYMPDPYNEITPNIGTLAKTLEDAKAQCERIWKSAKDKINSY